MDHCTLVDEIRLACPVKVLSELTSRWNSTHRVTQLLGPDCSLLSGQHCMPSPTTITTTQAVSSESTCILVICARMSDLLWVATVVMQHAIYRALICPLTGQQVLTRCGAIARSIALKWFLHQSLSTQHMPVMRSRPQPYFAELTCHHYFHSILPLQIATTAGTMARAMVAHTHTLYLTCLVWTGARLTLVSLLLFTRS